MEELSYNLNIISILFLEIKEKSGKFTNSDFILKNEDLYYEKIFNDHTIGELCYTPDLIDRDESKILRSIMEKSDSCEYNIDQIRELIDNSDISYLWGYICLSFSKSINISDKYILKNIKDWFKIHRCYLAQFPHDKIYFYQEITKYYPNLLFNDNVLVSLNSLSGGLLTHSKAIIRSLSKLNDNFLEIQGANIAEKLRIFNARCNINSSLEGDMTRKKDFTFSFNCNGNNHDICCEPHIRLETSYIPGDTHYYYDRIYFFHSETHQCGNKILIGHIGKHL